jgi:hypothetical protein
MMSEQQFETILTAIADVQVAVDAMGLDVQRVVEILAWTDTDNPQPPAWANPAGHKAAEDAAGETEEHYSAVAYPPPARGDVGAAAGYVVAAACAALLVVLLALLWLVGN